MKKITGKEEVGNCLLLLVFFSMQITYEIVDKKKGCFSNDISSSIFEIDNILLIMIPILIYLSFKTEDLFLRSIYLLSTLPFLFSSSVFDFLRIGHLYYINIPILSILILCLIKYIHQTFESYKAIYLKKQR